MKCPRSRAPGNGALVVLLLAILGACSSAVPAPGGSPQPGTFPGPGSTPHLGGTSAPAPIASTAASPSGSPWTRVEVREPGVVTDAPPGSPPVFCSPCHAAQISLAFAVASTPFGLVAIGIQEPPAFAVAWVSSDARTWKRVADFPADEGSAALAIAAGAGRVVVVGRDNAGATSWESTDGTRWSRSPDSAALAGPAGATQMTSITAWNGQFIAVGYSDDPIHGTATAAAWSSVDGLAWQRLSVGDPSLAGAHMLAVAAGEPGLVAVGTTGDETDGSGVAWFSAAGVTWNRSGSTSLAGGILRAVTPLGSGFLAVGLRSADDGAAAWRSADGVSWVAVPDQPAFRFGTAPARMVALAQSGDEIVGVGWKSDAGNGSATAWNSADGLAWSHDASDTSFSGAQMAGAAASRFGVVAVGTAGYPDNDAAQMWLRPR